MWMELMSKRLRLKQRPSRILLKPPKTDIKIAFGLTLNAILFFSERQVTYKEAVMDTNLGDVDKNTNKVIEQIDNAGKKAVKLTFDVMKRNIPDNLDPLIHISNELDALFGAQPVFSGAKEDARLGRYEACLLLDSLPYFKTLGRKSGRNLYPSIHQYIGDLLESGYFEIPEKEQVTDLLNTNSSYDRWSPLMINALMMVLFEPIQGVQFIHATTPLQRAK